jgi:hypothetical protein
VISLADARIKRDNAKKLLGEGMDPSADRKEERRNARIARANDFVQSVLDGVSDHRHDRSAGHCRQLAKRSN